MKPKPTQPPAESFGPYILRCPECEKIVDTVPAEGVPDQTLRGCPSCFAVFSQSEADTRKYSNIKRLEWVIGRMKNV